MTIEGQIQQPLDGCRGRDLILMDGAKTVTVEGQCNTQLYVLLDFS